MRCPHCHQPFRFDRSGATPDLCPACSADLTMAAAVADCRAHKANAERAVRAWARGDHGLPRIRPDLLEAS